MRDKVLWKLSLIYDFFKHVNEIIILSMYISHYNNWLLQFQYVRFTLYITDILGMNMEGLFTEDLNCILD